MATFQPSAQADHFQPQNTQNWTLEQLNKVTCPNRLCFLLLHEDSQVSCLPGEETATYQMHLGKRPAGLRSIMLSLETSGPLIRMLLLQLPRALTLLRTTCTNCKNCSRITFKYQASKSNCACVGWTDLWIIPQDGTELFWLHEE